MKEVFELPKMGSVWMQLNEISKYIYELSNAKYKIKKNAEMNKWEILNKILKK